MNIRRTKTNKGSTIVELIIYMFFLSVFFIILTNIFVTALETRLEAETTSAVSIDGRFILTRLIYDIKRSEAIISPTLGQSSMTMNLLLSGVDTTYQLQGGNLVIINNNGTNQLNSVNTRLTNLTFKRVGNSGGKNTIRVNFTIESITAVKSGPRVQSFTTTVSTR